MKVDLSKNINSYTRARKKKSKNRKIIAKIGLIQIAFLMIASHFAQAKIVGIIKIYLLELVLSSLALISVINFLIKREESKRSFEMLKEEKYDNKEIQADIKSKKNINYNWIIEGDEGKIEKEEILEDTESSKETKILEEEPSKYIYKSPFEPILKEKIELELESCKQVKNSVHFIRKSIILRLRLKEEKLHKVYKKVKQCQEINI